MIHESAPIEFVKDVGALPVLQTGYNVAQVAVGGVILLGAAAAAVWGIRKMFQAALGNS